LLIIFSLNNLNFVLYLRLRCELKKVFFGYTVLVLGSFFIIVFYNYICSVSFFLILKLLPLLLYFKLLFFVDIVVIVIFVVVNVVLVVVAVFDIRVLDVV
jgi:hypothetical protein